MLKVFLVFAYLMEVVVDVSFWNAPKGLKVARCSAKHMVVVNGAHLKDVTRGQKEARHIARATVVEKDVHLKVT